MDEKNIRRLVVLLLILLPPLSSAASGSQEPFPVDGDASLVISEGWEYLWGDQDAVEHIIPPDGWRRMPHFPGTPPERNGNTILWLRTTLPENRYYPSPGIFIPRMYLLAECYLDGRLIYHYGTTSATGKNRYLGLPWHLISLSGHPWEGRQLVFKIRSEYSIIGIKHSVTLGDRAELTGRIVRNDLARILLAVLFFWTGAFTITTYFIQRRFRLFLIFGLISLSAAFHTIYYSNIKQLYLNAPYIWNYIWLVSTTVMIVGALRFIEELFGYGRRNIIRIVGNIHILYTIFSLTLFIFRFLGSASALATGRLILYAAELAVIAPIITRALLKSNTEAKILIGGVGVFVTFMGFDLLVAMQLLTRYKFNTQWGLFFLILSFGIILIRRIITAQNIAIRYYTELEQAKQRERQMIYADIHDHLGSRLNDMSILLSRSREEDSSEAELLGTLQESVGSTLRTLRERIAVVEDLELLAKDFLYGLQLILLRRYSNSGRKVLFKADKEVREMLEKDEFREITTGLYPVCIEIATNDIKYGRGVSEWHFTLTPGRKKKVELTVRASTAYRTAHGRPHRGEKNIRLRISEIQGEVRQQITGEAPGELLFTIKISIPLKSGRLHDEAFLLYNKTAASGGEQ